MYITVTNVYISPDQNLDIDNPVKIFTAKSLIVGDLNAKNTLWGSPHNDHRGTTIEHLIDENKFVVLNNGQATYTHHTGPQSHLDLSIVCHTLGTKSTWDVFHDTFGSDHCPTVTCIYLQLRK